MSILYPIGVNHLIVLFRNEPKAFLVTIPLSKQIVVAAPAFFRRRSRLSSRENGSPVPLFLGPHFFARVCSRYVHDDEMMKKKRRRPVSNLRPLAWLRRNGSGLTHYSTMPLQPVNFTIWCIFIMEPGLFISGLGGYANCVFGFVGLIGNIVSIAVLSRKELRKSCFNQLLIGKWRSSGPFTNDVTSINFDPHHAKIA